MSAAKKPKEWFTRRELRVFSRLNSPARIQAFLAELPYSTEGRYRSPRSVLKDRMAHCFDGALFSAAALRLLGHPPLVLEMHAKNDDCHLLALYQRGACWGAVAKSNFVGLRFREPIYRTLHELVLSYFESFYNVLGQKTLRSYSQPLNLAKFDGIEWMRDDTHLEAISSRLDVLKRTPVLPRGMEALLSPVDRRFYEAGLLGANPAGLYRPRRRAK